MRFWLAAVSAVALSAIGRSAEAQARGTLQATATVVDTRQGFEALAAVRQAVTNSRTDSADPVTTVALISTERSAAKPSTLVVTVEFSRN
jgi:hypothetical protein